MGRLGRVGRLRQELRWLNFRLKMAGVTGKSVDREQTDMKTNFIAVLIMLTVSSAAGAAGLIHCTDLYHPHNDPDDHWDLATVYALAKAGRLELLGVVLDGSRVEKSFGDPAVCAVAQMNHIAGMAAPVVVGCLEPYRPGIAGDRGLAAADLAAARFLIDTLRQSAEKVYISIVGSSRDVAIASELAPEVFRKKCAGIYLNAGTGTTDPAVGANEEWNVLLGAASYRRIFEIPCPIYWLPCFEQMRFEDGGGQRVCTYGTYWRFKQGDVLPGLSKPVQNYFLYALTRSDDQRWLRYLYKDVDGARLEEFGKQMRNMWCTAGFLHMCGLSVEASGQMGKRGDGAVFSFQPVRIELNEKGVADWQKEPGANRWILQVEDTEAYAGAMCKALAAVLGKL